MQNRNRIPGFIIQHLFSILLLAGMLIASFIGVRVWKTYHPGAMTVIEAQAMDMAAMKPPIGAVPVATEVVGRSSFSAKVTYTGSVAPYTEQTIYPRVEGWLKGLSTYNGDRVAAGQLLAVVDSPDLQTRVAEAAAGRVAATSEIGVARSSASRMAAERAAARGEIETAKSEVASANARLSAVRKGVAQAQADLKSAKANQEYWQAEIKREENLLKAGAVSKQEYQSEKAQAAAADADADNKASMLEQARANVQAAQAEVASKKTMVSVAGQRATASDAALNGSYGEIAQKTAMARQAAAMQATASTFSDYRFIRAPFSGVVTKRYLSPGQLVNASTAVLNIAQIDKVRLQANVADRDIASIKIGAPVVAAVSKAPGLVYHTRVTSISPSSDQSSRTGLVEAIVDNSGHKLNPGDFVTMEIAASAATTQITVPSSSLVQRNGRDAVWVVRSEAAKGKMTYYCTMHPEVVRDKPGNCPKCGMKLEPKTSGGNKKAHLAYVTLGADDGERTEVLSGLCDGEEVIYQGQTYLQEGDIVFPTKWGAAGPEALPKSPGMGEMKGMPGMGGSSSMPGMPGMDRGAKGNSGSMPDMPGMDHATKGNSGSMPDMPGMDHSAKGNSGSMPDMPGMDHSKMQTQKPSVKAQKTYVCPMHPEVTSHKPGQKCPKCGMNLEEKK
jgi:multidrug efflux pump subunit AcrA (membrane-fusion protein)